MTAYIITRNRLDNLKKIMPRWIDQGISVVFVVERVEQWRHERLIKSMDWVDARVISPDQQNRGVGYARAFAVRDASHHHLSSIIMSDDDMRPANGSDMGILLREADRVNVLGIGATRSLHDRFSGGVTKNHKGIILCPGGWGMQLFALNVTNAIAVGNFDERLDCYGEDHELMRNGIVYGLPWLVHCGVKCEAIGVRYDPGGLNSYIDGDNRSEREIACQRIIYRRWPHYVNAPGKRPSTQWAKLMDQYIPGWRAESAIHGGEWR